VEVDAKQADTATDISVNTVALTLRRKGGTVHLEHTFPRRHLLSQTHCVQGEGNSCATTPSMMNLWILILTLKS
jgi:hypothetical protein